MDGCALFPELPLFQCTGVISVIRSADKEEELVSFIEKVAETKIGTRGTTNSFFSSNEIYIYIICEKVEMKTHGENLRAFVFIRVKINIR